MKPCLRRLILLGPFAQLALVLAILLQRWARPSLDFWAGALTGFSIVGNLAAIYATSRGQKGRPAL
jgi:hypothetical protein